MPRAGNMSPLGRLLRNRLPGNGRRDRQDPADRLDAVDNALILNEDDHRFSGRTSSVPLHGNTCLYV